MAHDFPGGIGMTVSSGFKKSHFDVFFVIFELLIRCGVKGFFTLKILSEALVIKKRSPYGDSANQQTKMAILLVKMSFWAFFWYREKTLDNLKITFSTRMTFLQTTEAVQTR